MLCVARIIAKNYPYHVTQRGNYRQTAFESDASFRKGIESGSEEIVQYSTPGETP